MSFFRIEHKLCANNLLPSKSFDSFPTSLISWFLFFVSENIWNIINNFLHYPFLMFHNKKIHFCCLIFFFGCFFEVFYWSTIFTMTLKFYKNFTALSKLRRPKRKLCLIRISSLVAIHSWFCNNGRVCEFWIRLKSNGTCCQYPCDYVPNAYGWRRLSWWGNTNLLEYLAWGRRLSWFSIPCCR